MPTSPDGAIEVANVWKRFRRDRANARLASEVAHLARGFARRDSNRWRWVLRNISFRLEPGESVGLVGANGSGKTTLLRLLTKVMYPYSGTIEVGGRVAALIDVRAGLHPELSGAQNIFFFGALLGLGRREVAARFDDIVGFAELESALDRQVKYYSTGMQMRLGFAVASFLDPAVLLVDEVLAVGDASFQQRCLERLRELLSRGTTLLFVSHDLAAVEATCARAIWLSEGVIKIDGPVADVLRAYRQSLEEHSVGVHSRRAGVVSIVSAAVCGTSGVVATGDNAIVELVLDSGEPHWCAVCVGVSEGPSAPIFVLRRDMHLESGVTGLRCTMQDLPIPGGRYWLWVGVFDRTGGELSPWHATLAFEVAGPSLDVTPPAVDRRVPVHVDSSWEMGPA